MAVVTEIPWEQVVRFAHLLQSCYRSYASTPKRDTSSKSLRHLSDPSPCYRNGHFAFLFYSSVFCNSSLSDTELGFCMMRVLSPILCCLSSFGLMPLLVSCTFVACRSLCIIVHAPPSSADTAVRSDFPLRFSRHTAIAVPLSVGFAFFRHDSG